MIQFRAATVVHFAWAETKADIAQQTNTSYIVELLWKSGKDIGQLGSGLCHVHNDSLEPPPLMEYLSQLVI